MKRFPAKLKARGLRELPLKLDSHRFSGEFEMGGSSYYIDVMQSAVFLMQALHRSAWDYGTYTQADMFDKFERHFAELKDTLSEQCDSKSVGDIFLDALDYLVADRYLIRWNNEQTGEPEYILFNQHSILGTPDQVVERFGDYKTEKAQMEIMKVWLEAHTPVDRTSAALSEYKKPEQLPPFKRQKGDGILDLL